MSYEFGMFFKNCQSYENALKVATEFTEACYSNAKELLQTEAKFIPSVLNDKENSDADKYWLFSVFTFKFVYWPMHNLLAVSGHNYPKEAEELFDGHVTFQNATDQNYEYGDWPNKILFFKECIEIIQDNSLDELQELSKRISARLNPDEYTEDYFRKKLLYDLVFYELHLGDWLYGETHSSYQRFSLCAIDSQKKHLQLSVLLRHVVKEENNARIRELAELVAPQLNLQMDKFEPTDTEGHALEGIVSYKGNNYFIYLTSDNPDSYEMQAAIQIIERIKPNK